MGTRMRGLIIWQSIIPVLCCLTLWAGSAQAEPDAPESPSAKNRILAPVKIDDTYLLNSIPPRSQEGTLTLHGAVEEAAVHNKDVQESDLEVSRFKWDYLAAETAR